MPVHEVAASGSVNPVLKHEKNNVTAAQVSASPCFVKLHQQCFKMCVHPFAIRDGVDESCIQQFFAILL